jgi:hypothetical protein
VGDVVGRNDGLLVGTGRLGFNVGDEVGDGVGS